MQNRFEPRLSAKLPEGWLAKESLTLLAPDGQANVIASSEPLDPSIDTKRYATEQSKILRKQFEGYHEFHAGPTEVWGGRQGYIRRFEWIPPDGQPITQMQLYYVENGRGYTATATTPASEVPQYELLLREVLGGIRMDP